MPERFKVVCIPCTALYNCSALPFLKYEHKKAFKALSAKRKQSNIQLCTQRPHTWILLGEFLFLRRYIYPVTNFPDLPLGPRLIIREIGKSGRRDYRVVVTFDDLEKQRRSVLHDLGKQL